ncbi:hypothetical protein AB8A05_04125 [Tardiphaga sp. 538_B7_N1_4]|uniref:hypothetical protein n=1 Tax=Tardiphaga sp. 538_B7_N1_4 TaxID=3240778 RepID=UPI003F254642
MGFEPGNKLAAGGRKDKPFRDALRMELAALGEDDPKGLRGIARNLLKIAAGDDGLPAIKEIADRLDGKPAQAIENGEDGAFQVIQRIERIIVSPEDRDS